MNRLSATTEETARLDDKFDECRRLYYKILKIKPVLSSNSPANACIQDEISLFKQRKALENNSLVIRGG